MLASLGKKFYRQRATLAFRRKRQNQSKSRQIKDFREKNYAATDGLGRASVHVCGNALRPAPKITSIFAICNRRFLHPISIYFDLCAPISGPSPPLQFFRGMGRDSALWTIQSYSKHFWKKLFFQNGSGVGTAGQFHSRWPRRQAPLFPSFPSVGKSVFLRVHPWFKICENQWLQTEYRPLQTEKFYEYQTSSHFAPCVLQVGASLELGCWWLEFCFKTLSSPGPSAPAISPSRAPPANGTGSARPYCRSAPAGRDAPARPPSPPAPLPWLSAPSPGSPP